MLLTFIKLPFVIKSLFYLFLSGRLSQVLLYFRPNGDSFSTPDEMQQRAASHLRLQYFLS